MPKYDMAVYQTVHDVGAEEIAKLTGKKVGTVYNKANADCEHDFTGRELIAICSVTNDYRILQAIAQDLDHVAVPLGNFHRTSDVELLNLHMRCSEAAGERDRVIRRAWEDGKITKAELEEIRDRILAEVQTEFELLGRLEGMAR